MTRHSEDVSSVILAGGQSKRMGSNKALLSIRGITFIESIIQTLERRFTHIYISAGSADEYEFLTYPFIPDIFRNCGPLAGIHAALMTIDRESLFTVTCDVPFVSENVIDLLLESIDPHRAVLAHDGERLHPLIGIYPRSACDVIEQYLQAGGRHVKRFLDHVGYKQVDISRFAHEVKNCNTIAEYERMIRG
jgi:molybdenum cofactor guanylyltransferase